MQIFFDEREIELSKNNDISFSQVASEYREETNVITAWLSGQEEFSFQTSGSTGTPKIIMHQRMDIIKSIQSTAHALSLDENHTFLCCINSRFIGGFMMIARALELHSNLIITKPKANPVNKINKPIDFIALVPYQLEKIIEDGDFQKIAKSKIILGGAPMSKELLDKCKQLKAPHVYQTYGMTETISHIALKKIDSDNQNEEYRVLEAFSVTEDARGCLLVDTPFSFGAVHTNDLVKITSPDNFLWKGRYDNVINSGGVKISPEIIEPQIGDLLLKCNLKNDFFVGGVRDPKLGPRLTLFLEGEKSNSKKLEIIQEFQTSFSKYHVPKQIICVENFSRTPTGKINRKLSSNNEVVISLNQ